MNFDNIKYETRSGRRGNTPGIYINGYNWVAYTGEAGQRFHAKLDTHSRASWTVGA